MKRKKFTFLFVVFFIMMTAGAVKADGHLVLEQVRKYMNNVFPKTITNVWICENAFTVKNNNSIFIYRRDLGKVWTILPAKNKYYEEAINAEVKDEEKQANDNPSHKTGYNYQPVFEWVVKETGKNEMAGDKECSKAIALGEADYARKNIEILFTKNSPFDLNDLYKEMLKYTLSDDWKNVYKMYPDLYNSLSVKSKEVTENAIAPVITIEREITKMEKSNPPENIYEVPKGCVKVNSIDELYN